jgi:hypothetical protein
MENFIINKTDFNMGLPILNYHTAGIDASTGSATVLAAC